MTPSDATSPITERWSRANGGIERRATPREPVLLPALLIEADGRRRPCVILDRSEGGLRLNLSGDEPAPDAFCVLDLVTGMGREVQVAWRKPPELGVRVNQHFVLAVGKDPSGRVLVHDPLKGRRVLDPAQPLDRIDWAGQMYLPYGLRLQDDSAFIRENTGISFNTPDRGFELGFDGMRWTAQLAVSNGTAGAPEVDKGKQWSLRAEYVAPRWRAGGSYNINDFDAGSRSMQNLFAGLRTGPVAW